MEALISNQETSQHMTDLKQVYNNVEINLTAASQKVMKRKLPKGEDDSFLLGEKVRKNIREEQRKGEKLEPDLLGP